MKIIKSLLLSSLLFINNSYAENLTRENIFNSVQSSSLSSKIGTNFNIQEKPLSAEQAFNLSSKMDNKKLTFDFIIAENHYLYVDQFELYINGKKQEIKIQNYIEKEDLHYGKVNVINGFNTFSVESLDEIKNYRLIYQGCSEKFNICYDKITYNFTIPEHTVIKEDKNMQSQNNDSNINKEEVLIEKESDKELIVKEQINKDNLVNDELTKKEIVKENNIDKLKNVSPRLDSYVGSDVYIKNILKKSELWQVLMFFFLGGVLISFTPCVLPMIPIVSSIVIGKQESITQLRAFSLSLSYVIGSSVTYALLGLAAALLSENIQAYMQNIYVISIFSIILFILGLSMFGIFNINGSQKLNNVAYEYSNKLSGGEHIQVFIMGMLSTLILSPCVAAPIAAAITYISTTNDILKGTLSMFVFGLGIGSVLILITTTLNKFKIKSGQWMNEIKYLTGLIIILMSVYLCSSFVRDDIIFIAYVTIIVSYLVSFYARNYEKMKWFLILIIGILSLSLYFKPVNVKSEINNISYKKVYSIEELNSELKDNKYTILKFTADWCVYCKTMDKEIFNNIEMIEKLKNYEVIYIDITTENENSKKIKEKYEVFAPPVIVFLENHDIFYKETGYNKDRLIQLIDSFNKEIDKINTGEENGR